MRVSEFWRQVGVVTSNEDTVTHSRPHPCPLYSLPSTVFFKIHKDHGTASVTLIQVTLQKQQDNVNASLEGDGQTRVNSIVPRAVNHHGLHLCFGCAARSLPGMWPPRVLSLMSTPTQMTPGASRDGLTSSQHNQVVGGCDDSSHLTESVKHAPSLPLKQLCYVPQEIYTVPDWNSPLKQTPSLPDSRQSSTSGTSPPTCWPIPTSSQSKQLVLEELHIITGTTSSTPCLTRTSGWVVSGTHNQWKNKYYHLIDSRMWMKSSAPPHNSISIRCLQTGIPSLPTWCTESQTWHVPKKITDNQWLWWLTLRDLMILTLTYQSR